MRNSLPLFSGISLGLVLFSSCEKEQNTPLNNSSVTAPMQYSFERNGVSTVNYSGQSERLAMGNELSDALLDFSKSTSQIQEMYANADANGNDVDPYTDPSLNTSTKSIRSKVAASYDLFSANTALSAQIKSDLDSFIVKQVSEIFSAQSAAASAGQAGQIADGSSVRYVNAQGFEYNQFLIKALIGALCTDQILNNYLSSAVLDEGSNRSNNNQGILLEGTNYTNMEHKWDEAYGYLFGMASDGSDPLASLGNNDQFLNKYLARVNSDSDFSSYAIDIFNAFKLGRAAIVAGEYEVRDEQIRIIKEKISNIIGIRSVYYLQSAKLAFAANNYGTAFHDLSEAYGFIYSLMFSQNPSNGEPYFTYNEVKGILSDLQSDGPNGFWDLEASTLDNLSNQIASRFSFSLNQAAN
jgi:hypothetical protein